MTDNSQDKSQNVAHKELLSQLLSLKAVGFLVAFGVIIISISKFIDSVSTLARVLPTQEATISTFDINTQEQTLSVAKRIDDLCSSIVVSDQMSYSLHAENYRIIDVELNNFLLRQESRPLNSASVEQKKLVIENFHKLWNKHKSTNELSVEWVKEMRSLFHKMFQQILYLEASKIKG